MTDPILVGPWVRRFLVEYVIKERNYTSNTQLSYRDTFLLFLPLAAKRCRCPADRLPLARITPKVVREFIQHLQRVRHCSPATLNQSWRPCVLGPLLSASTVPNIWNGAGKCAPYTPKNKRRHR